MQQKTAACEPWIGLIDQFFKDFKASAFYTKYQKLHDDASWAIVLNGRPLKQTFLNTCTALVFAEEIRLRAPSIFFRIFLARNLQRRLEENFKTLDAGNAAVLSNMPWDGSKTTYLEAIQHYLNKSKTIEKNCEKLLTIILQRFELKGSPLPQKSLQLNKEWGKWMEILLSLISLLDQDWQKNPRLTLSSPFILPFSWWTNAALYIAAQPFLKALRPAKVPSLKARWKKGCIDYDTCLKELRQYVKLSTPTETQETIYALGPKDKKLIMSSAGALLIEKLHKTIADENGVRGEADGHAYFLQATFEKNIPIFWIYDPLKGKHTSLSIKAMQSLLKKMHWFLFIDKQLLARE